MSTVDPHPALQEAARRVLDEHGLVLEEVVVRGRSGVPEVRIIVDLPEDARGAVDMDTVAAAARRLNELIDEDESLLGPGPSLVEVTTPGVDRSLTAPRHFRRNRGRLLELELTSGAVHRARLLEVSADDALTLRPEPGRDDRGRPVKLPKDAPARLEVPFADVERARVQIEFDPPADLEQLLGESARPTAEES
ncbi:ribosome maturation factor RimP [Brachybacterium sp. DNPG3]